MKLRIGFSRPKKGFIPFAKAIMWYQNTDYSHAYVRFHSDSTDRDLIYQASSTMVNFWGGAYFDSKEITVAEYEMEVDDAKKTELMQFFIDNAGVPYAKSQIIGILLYKQFGWKIFRNDTAQEVCSELVARILGNLKVPIDFPKDIDYVMPKDVRAIMDANPHIFKRVV